MAVSLKKTGVCALLVEVADNADLEAEAEVEGGSAAPSPGARRRGIFGAKLKALRKAASEIGSFKAEVGMELRAKKRPLGHRNMVADRYYACIVVGVNADGSLRGLSLSPSLPPSVCLLSEFHTHTLTRTQCDTRMRAGVGSRMTR